MNVTRLLWGLWGALILSMLLRQTIDTYMVVALIIIPVLIVLLDLHEEIARLKEENKHQRKFVLDRYNLLQERLNDAFNQIEKRMVVDFAEIYKTDQQTTFPQASSGYVPPERRKPRKLKKRQRTNFSQKNPFEEQMKTEDERFAEEKFGTSSINHDDYEEVPNFAEEDDEEEFDQDSYDEQVYDQPSNEFETDEEEMNKDRA